MLGEVVGGVLEEGLIEGEAEVVATLFFVFV